MLEAEKSSKFSCMAKIRYKVTNLNLNSQHCGLHLGFTSLSSTSFYHGATGVIPSIHTLTSPSQCWAGKPSSRSILDGHLFQFYSRSTLLNFRVRTGTGATLATCRFQSLTSLWGTHNRRSSEDLNIVLALVCFSFCVPSFLVSNVRISITDIINISNIIRNKATRTVSHPAAPS